MRPIRPFITCATPLTARESELRHTVKEKEQIEHLLGEIKDRLKNELKLQLAVMKERLNV